MAQTKHQLWATSALDAYPDHISFLDLSEVEQNYAVNFVIETAWSNTLNLREIYISV